MALKYAETDLKYLKPEDLVQTTESGNETELKRILVTTEVVAQVLPYINYMHGKQTGKHMIVDIGGSTIDFSIFELANGFQKVEFLGTYVYIGAMDIIEKRLQKEEISPVLYGKLTDEELKIIHDHFQKIRDDLSIPPIRQEFIGKAYEKRKDTSEWEDVHVLLAGGGSYKESPFFNDLCEIFSKQFLESNAPKEKPRKNYEVMPYSAMKLPDFDISECRDADSHTHRLLVAYGLCFKKDEYPESSKPFDVRPKSPHILPHIMDDEWREPYL
jgi:hypothetical protein